MVTDTDMEKGAHIVALAIHGGAGTTTREMPADLVQAYRDRLRAVLSTTYDANHTSSLEAVCHAVSLLEDSPLFNAGKGAVFDLAGNTVCECSLMTTQPGFNSRTVAVTGVRRTKNPILLARVLMEKNKVLGGHAFYSGLDAEEAGWKYGTEKVSYKYYYTKRRWNEHKNGMDSRLGKLASDLVKPHEDEGDGDLPAYTSTHTPISSAKVAEHEDQAIFDRYADLSDYLPQGTVGAVALDSNGYLSVATSTGGKTNKYPGRIGDTPSVGTGYLADTWTPSASPHRHRHTSTSSSFVRFVRRIFCSNSSTQSRCEEQSEEGIAISGTGDGDFFLRTTFASTIAHCIKFGGTSFPASIDAAMDELVASYGGKGVGGAIILDKTGNAYFPLAANTMNRGLISQHTGFKPKVAIFDDEQLA